MVSLTICRGGAVQACRGGAVQVCRVTTQNHTEPAAFLPTLPCPPPPPRLPRLPLTSSAATPEPPHRLPPVVAAFATVSPPLPPLPPALVLPCTTTSPRKAAQQRHQRGISRVDAVPRDTQYLPHPHHGGYVQGSGAVNHNGAALSISGGSDGTFYHGGHVDGAFHHDGRGYRAPQVGEGYRDHHQGSGGLVTLRRDGILICNFDKVSEIRNDMSWWDTVKVKSFWNPPIMYELFGSFTKNPAMFAQEISYLTWKLQRGEIRPKVAGRVSLVWYVELI